MTDGSTRGNDKQLATHQLQTPSPPEFLSFPSNFWSLNHCCRWIKARIRASGPAAVSWSPAWDLLPSPIMVCRADSPCNCSSSTIKPSFVRTQVLNFPAHHAFSDLKVPICQTAAVRVYMLQRQEHAAGQVAQYMILRRAGIHAWDCHGSKQAHAKYCQPAPTSSKNAQKRVVTRHTRCQRCTSRKGACTRCTINAKQNVPSPTRYCQKPYSQCRTDAAQNSRRCSMYAAVGNLDKYRSNKSPTHSCCCLCSLFCFACFDSLDGSPAAKRAAACALSLMASGVMDKVLLARALAAVAILVILAWCCFLVDLLGP